MFESKPYSFANNVRRWRRFGKIGTGREKKVYLHPDNHAWVCGIFHIGRLDPSWAIDTFYTIKLAHLLHRDSIPDIHLSTSNPATIIRDRVSGKKGGFLRALWSLFSETYPYDGMFDALSYSGFEIDDVPQNYIHLGSKRVYVDDVIVKDGRRLKQAIETQLTGDDQVRARRYYERLLKTWECT